MQTTRIVLLALVSSAYAFQSARTHTRRALGSLKMQQKSELLQSLSLSITTATGQPFDASFAGGGMGGGGGASVGTLKDKNSGQEYFYKMSGMGGMAMLRAEYTGIKEMYETNTIRVPQPICYGASGANSFVVFEKLSIGGYGGRSAAEEMGRQLARMHRKTSSNKMFGWDIHNTIGATFQPNDWTESWVDFWDTHRLGHMLHLCKRDGAAFPREQQLRTKVAWVLYSERAYTLLQVRQILSTHKCVPSLVHGDLWSGNTGYVADGAPVIFDPATYYGDREVDIAMTYLFGRFPAAFYEAYEQEWPLDEGHGKRREVYNLYHILNHFVLFGGSYLAQANSMIENILRM